MVPELSQEEISRYARHLTIPEIGIEGQRRLKAAAVLVVGIGGLGSAISLYLAAAGVGRIGLVDNDMVESSNLQRQVIHDTPHLGQPKVVSARQRISSINPGIQVDTYQEALSYQNAVRIANDYTIIMDGTDNLPSRYLINDLCVLTNKTYIYGSVFRFEGQVGIFDARRGPCYRCVFPEPPLTGAIPSGIQTGVFCTVPGTIGTIQATEALKYIIGIGSPMIGKLVLYNALEMDFQEVHLDKNPNCKVCSTKPEITQLLDYEKLYGRTNVEEFDQNK